MSILASGSSQQELGYSISLITVNTLGMIVNFIVVVMFFYFRHRLLKKTKNLLLFSMLIADLLVGMTGIIGGVLFHLYATGRSTVTMYKICGLLPLFGSFFISMLSLGIMTADRLISVKLPVKYSIKMNKRRTTMLIFSAWATVTVIIVILGVLFFTVSPKTELATRGYLLGTLFVVSSIILAVSNAHLFRKLRSIAAKRDQQNGFQSTAMDSLNTVTDQAQFQQESGRKQSKPKRVKNILKKYEVPNMDKVNGNETCTNIVQSKDVTMSKNDDTKEECTNRPTEKYNTNVEMGQKCTEKRYVDKGNSMICIWMTLLFIVCWFPASVYYTVWAITESAPVSRSLLAFCLCLASSNSLVNPLIYFAKRKDFREYLLKLLSMGKKKTYSESSCSNR